MKNLIESELYITESDPDWFEIESGIIEIERSFNDDMYDDDLPVGVL